MLFDETITLSDGCQLSYLPNFLSANDGNSLYNALLEHIDWQQNTINIFGREVLEPRLSAFVGENGIQYRYSNSLRRPWPWPDELLYLLNAVQKAANCDFNCALLNYYRDGNDSMGWHADNEPELGVNPIVASLSLGAERDFLIRKAHKRYNSEARRSNNQSIPLAHGSLLIMHAGMQHHWQHSIAKCSHINTGRINITFRKIIN